MGKDKRKFKNLKPANTKNFQIRDIPPVDYNKEKPSFSFCRMQHKSKYCLSHCEKEEKAAFADTLLHLTQATWGTLNQSHKHGMGYEKIDRSSIKAPIPKEITPEVDIIAFRFQGKKPMVGYRVKDMFYIVWIDRNFTLYPHS